MGGIKIGVGPHRAELGVAYIVGIGVGVLNLALYYLARYLFPNTRLNQYIASLVAGIFMAQFIYQMHGLFEMHFFAFVFTQNIKAKINFSRRFKNNFFYGNRLNRFD